MKFTIAFILSIGLTLSAYAQISFFQDADAFFKANVSAGLINYDAIAAQPQQINSLVKQIERFNLNNRTPEVEKAFYTNAYNILVIKQIVDNLPTQGPMEIPGFFNQKTYKISGKTMTLDQLEKEVLFKKFPDARLHFVLVCAAIGCPPISDYAYMPDSLETQIENKTREVLNINWYVRVYKNKTQISKVFEWYQSDFESDSTTIKSFINKYREVPIPDAHTLEKYEYDWSLNDSKNVRY